MKTFNFKFVTLMIATSLLVACGKSGGFQGKSVNSNSSVTNPDGSVDQDGSGVIDPGSNIVNFTPVSLTEFNNYVAVRPLNAPHSFKLEVNLSEVENGRYAGQLKLSYVDNGYQYTGVFEAGSGRNVKLSGLTYNNNLESEYNRWFNLNGKTAFSGVFQDSLGALVLVIDNTLNQGDGQGSGTLSGSIYYKNFPQNFAAQSPYRKCWHLTGVYTCRASAVTEKNAIYPADGFIKLGTFSGLSKSMSFK